MKVLITGATSGIGKAVAEKFAVQGHQVIACGRNGAALEQLENLHYNITPMQFDMTDKKAIADVGEQLQDIDTIIFNAGNCEYINDAQQFDAELFERIININLVSIGYGLQHWLPKLNHGGQVCFVSSSATIVPFPKAEAYGASKAGLSYLAQSLRLDLAKHDIAVTLLEPGFVETPLTDKNQFEMPFIVSAPKAASIMYQGIVKRKPLIRFPNRLIAMLQLFSWLPASLWQKIILKGSH